MEKVEFDRESRKYKNRTKCWFTSDTHFGHKSILYFHSKRLEMCGSSMDELKEDPKTAVEKHDGWLISLWNNTIGKNDNVYFLGDFSFSTPERTAEILSYLNGRKFLITGNHDKPLRGLWDMFEWSGQVREVKFTKDTQPYLDDTLSLELCHYPMIAWNRRTHGTAMIHGHTHGAINEINKDSGELRIDVGLDATDYKILELEDLYDKLVGIVNTNHQEAGNFNEYINWKMDKDGIKF